MCGSHCAICKLRQFSINPCLIQFSILSCSFKGVYLLLLLAQTSLSSLTSHDHNFAIITLFPCISGIIIKLVLLLKFEAFYILCISIINFPFCSKVRFCSQENLVGLVRRQWVPDSCLVCTLPDFYRSVSSILLSFISNVYCPDNLGIHVPIKNFIFKNS